MIVDDLNVDRADRASRPLKTDPPLIVDADAVLALPVTAQGLETVARQCGKVLQTLRRFDNCARSSAWAVLSVFQAM